jgi:hypothetical protein
MHRSNKCKARVLGPFDCELARKLGCHSHCRGEWQTQNKEDGFKSPKMLGEDNKFKMSGQLHYGEQGKINQMFNTDVINDMPAGGLIISKGSRRGQVGCTTTKMHSKVAHLWMDFQQRTP